MRARLLIYMRCTASTATASVYNRAYASLMPRLSVLDVIESRGMSRSSVALYHFTPPAAASERLNLQCEQLHHVVKTERLNLQCEQLHHVVKTERRVTIDIDSSHVASDSHVQRDVLPRITRPVDAVRRTLSMPLRPSMPLRMSEPQPSSSRSGDKHETHEGRGLCRGAACANCLSRVYNVLPELEIHGILVDP